MSKEEWAQSFKSSHDCHRCPFLKNSVDIGVGTVFDCDHVCSMDVDEIMGEMEAIETQGDDGGRR